MAVDLQEHMGDMGVHITPEEKAAWDAKQEAMTVDSSLSATSTNPIQNKAVKKALDGKASTGHTHAAASTASPGFMQAADKRKLDGIAENANSYTHPPTHPGSMVEQDTTHRFVSDAEKRAWDGVYEQSTGYTDQKIADLIGGDPETLGTLKEFAEAVKENGDLIAGLNDAIGKKASQAELDTHTGNSMIHVTATDKGNWDKAMGERTAAFTQAASRANIASGEKLSTILGKVRKFFADLKAVAFTGSYNDLTDRPSIPSSPGDVGAAAAAHTHSYAGASSPGGALTAGVSRAADTSDAPRKLWFDSPDATVGEGKPAYDTNFTYNPATHNLKVANFNSNVISQMKVTYTRNTWYKIAVHNDSDAGGCSCIIDLKRVYNTNNNEYHRLFFLNTHKGYEFAPIASKSNSQVLTKARLVTNAGGKCYIEVYYAANSSNDGFNTVEGAIGSTGGAAWSALYPIADTETPEEGTVAAQFDIPKDFNAGMLVRKDYLEKHFIKDYTASRMYVFESSGWYRVARFPSPQRNYALNRADISCRVSIKRSWHGTNPDSHYFKLLVSNGGAAFIPDTHKNTNALTGMRYVQDDTDKMAYLEVYYSESFLSRAVISIENALGVDSTSWAMVDLAKVQENVSSQNLLASIEFPDDFDITMLARADGTNAGKFVLKKQGLYAYRDLADFYQHNGAPAYFRIKVPNIKTVYTAIYMEVSIRQAWGEGCRVGKLAIGGYHEVTAPYAWEGLNCSVVGSLSRGIKVYASDGEYIYLYGVGQHANISVDRVLAGSSAINQDLSGVAIDIVDSLPGTYQEARMERYNAPRESEGTMNQTGWWKFAELKVSGAANYSVYDGMNCIINIRRMWSNTQPEYHRVMLLNTSAPAKFVPVAGHCTEASMKIEQVRLTFDTEALVYTLEAYYHHSQGNLTYFSIEDITPPYMTPWTAVKPQLVTGEPSTKTVMTLCDISTPYDISMLALKGEAALKSIYGDNAVSFGRKAGAVVGEGSFAFGGSLEASGKHAHAEGYGTKATGISSHAEGNASDGDVVSSGTGSHAEGVSTGASHNGAHAEGGYTSASGEYAHAEGSHTRAEGICAHAEGGSTNAIGRFSHAEGGNTYARGEYAHAGGNEVTASNYASCAIGKYNYDRAEKGGAANNQVGDAFIVGNGVSTGGYPDLSNAFRVTYAGDVYGKKAFNASGADFAEWHEFADGNPGNEDRVGYFVTLAGGGKIRIADPGDYILGIVSGNPCVIGNADEDYYWKYARDGFNRIIMEDVPETVQEMEEVTEYIQGTDGEGNPLFDEETGEPVLVEVTKTVPVFDGEGRPVMVGTGKVIKNARMKLAEGYDPSLQGAYVERKYRKEWACIGMVGQVPVRDDGTCIPGQFCKCKDGGIATLAEGRGFDTYMVKGRVTDNIVTVILK